jgi:hypothetical protein
MTCGITKLIPRVFAPSYRFKSLKVPRNPGGLKKRAAKRRGKRLDAELASDQQTRTCAETKLIRTTLDSLQLDIVETQKMVQHQQLKTFLDLVVKHRITNKSFVVEIKRGCHYRRCATPTGKLLHQTSVLSDCLLYHHQLQALIGRWIAQQEVNWGVILIYVDQEKVEIFKDAEFEARLTDAGKTALLTACAKKQKARSAKRRKLK